MGVEKVRILPGKDACPCRAEVDVGGQLREIVSGGCLYKDAFISSGKDVSALAGLAVAAYGKGRLKPAHARDKVGLGSFQKDVIMVVHDDIGMDVPSIAGCRFSQSGYQEDFDGIVLKNVFPAIASCHDMVECSWKLDAWLPWHGLELNRPRE